MDYKTEIRNIVVDVTGLDENEVTGPEKFSDEFGMESVAVLKVIFKIESTFGIQIPERRYREMSTLDAAARVVAELAGAR